MVSRRYPLKQVLAVREHREEAAGRAMQASESEAREAEAASRVAAGAVADARRVLQDGDAERDAMLAGGELSAQTLAHHAAWQNVQRAAIDALESEAERRAERARHERADANACRGAYLDKRRDRELLTEHREAWQRDRARERAKRDEDEADDQWRPGATPPTRSKS